jgi:hypothetical protein
MGPMIAALAEYFQEAKTLEGIRSDSAQSDTIVSNLANLDTIVGSIRRRQRPDARMARLS